MFIYKHIHMFRLNLLSYTWDLLTTLIFHVITKSISNVYICSDNSGYHCHVFLCPWVRLIHTRLFCCYEKVNSSHKAVNELYFFFSCMHLTFLYQCTWDRFFFFRHPTHVNNIWTLGSFLQRIYSWCCVLANLIKVAEEQNKTNWLHLIQ